MMKMKKWFVLFMVGMMLMASFTACGSKKTESTDEAASTETQEAATESSAEETAESTKLILSWWGNQTRNERTQLVMEQFTQQNPDIEIEGQFAEWADYWNKLSTASAGHMLPDVVQMDYKYLEQYVDNNLLVDLTPYIESGVLDVSGIDENILNSAKVNDGIYAIPLGVNAPALMYNKTLLDENGITVKDNMSIDEFVALSKEVYEKTGYKTDVAFGNGDIFIEYMMRSLGAVLYDNGKIGATQEQLQKFFEVYEKGIAEGWMCAPDIYTERTIGTPEQMPLVYGSEPSSRSWCAFSYSNALTPLQNAAGEGTEIALTTWPADDQTKANFLKPAMFYAVTVDSKSPDAAVKFINHWTNDTAANEILLGERGVPASQKVSETIAAKLDANTQKAIIYINEVVSSNSSTINPPAPSGAAEVAKLIDQEVEKVTYQESSAADAAAELLALGNDMLAGK